MLERGEAHVGIRLDQGDPRFEGRVLPPAEALAVGAASLERCMARPNSEAHDTTSGLAEPRFPMAWAALVYCVAALSLAYAAQVEGDTVEERSAAYQALLAQKRDRELWQGTTLVGPHREDLAVSALGRALPSFASRGEQRSAVLSLKLAEAAWIRDRIGELPVFLLDDVLSELDPGRRDALVDALPENAQTLLTAAFEAGVPERLLERADVLRVKDGAIT